MKQEDLRLTEFYNQLECAHVFNKYIFYPKDVWRRHLHIKINNHCNMNCDFCIEKNTEYKSCVNDKWFDNLQFILHEFLKKGILKTVSITGGEPLLNIKETLRVLSILDQYKFDFVNINTNGSLLHLYSKELAKHKINCINISRHHYDENINASLFKTIGIKNNIDANSNIKLRYQCVCQQKGINSKIEIEKYMETYAGYVYDFSFRQLIKPEKSSPCFDQWQSNNVSLKPVYREFLLDSNYESTFIHNDEYEYYVEFQHKTDKRKKFLLCYTDMDKIYSIENSECDNIFREFVYFPDGLLSGSWNRVRKILSYREEDGN